MFVLDLRCAHQCWTLVGHVLRTSVCAVVMSVRYTSYGVWNVSRERDRYSFWCRPILVLASVHEIVTWPKYTCIWAVRDAPWRNFHEFLRHFMIYTSRKKSFLLHQSSSFYHIKASRIGAICLFCWAHKSANGLKKTTETLLSLLCHS